MISPEEYKEALNRYSKELDPTIMCAEPGCTCMISFKTHWLLYALNDERSIFTGLHPDRDNALEWFRDRAKAEWYCTLHNES